MAIPSRSQADKAGDRLKRFVREGGDTAAVFRNHPLHNAVLMAQAWRGQFSGTLTGVNMGARSMARTCGVDAKIAQRHKRLERIVQKLARPKSTRLSVMQDIAGVRAVVPSLADLRKLEAHVRGTWSDRVPHTAGQVVDWDDYVTSPRDSGYRALHLIVEYNGLPAELQIRTQGQHIWAEAVETVSRAINLELKAGEIPDELGEFFVEASELIAKAEGGEIVHFERTLSLSPWGVPRSLTFSSDGS